MEENNSDNLEIKKNHKKTELYIELGLILALGFFLGIGIKNEAEKKITIGFNDYKMKMEPIEFSLNKMQKDLLTQQMNENK